MWYSLVEIKKTGQDEMSARVTTDSNSLWFSGHFPDDPILPGIAQLDMVANYITATKEDAVSMTGLSRIRFKKIVRPGEPLDIHVTDGKKSNQYTFRITSGDQDVCSGMMRFTKKNNCPEAPISAQPG